jgi:NodT family efflux transporter outer membrane factor (OMF) lipoprotein
MRIIKTAATALAATLLAGCVSGPDYKRPDVATPGKWSEPLQGGEKEGEPDIATWWKTFGDPTLDSLIDRAAKSNQDARIAESRIREARAALNVTETGLWPQLNASGAYSRVQDQKTGAGDSDSSTVTVSGDGVTVTRANQSPSGATLSTSRTIGAQSASSLSYTPGQGKQDRQNNLFQTGLDASWELDLFGGVKRSVEASKADLAAVEESLRDVQVTLAAEVALNYFNLRANQNILDIVNKNIGIQRESLDLVRARFQAGLTTELDVKNAEAQLASSQAALPSVETGAKQSIHRLGVLLGGRPGMLQDELAPTSPLPKVPPSVPVGLPSDLLRRRPDIRRAERNLAAATARIGVATADLFPRISLTSAIARRNSDFGGLTAGTGQFWSIGPSISWPVFDAGRIRANIRIQNERQEQALAAYEKAVNASFEDVENAIVAFAKEQNQFDSLSQAVDANSHALELATEQYSKGLINYIGVLDVQRSLFSSERQRTQSEAAIIADLVSLYKALGGGWDAKAANAPQQTDVQPTPIPTTKLAR